MKKEDFQAYYDSNRYPDEIFLTYYMENASDEKRITVQEFLEVFPLWRRTVDLLRVLYTVINFYIDKFGIKRKYQVMLLDKNGEFLKHLPPIYDRIKQGK